MSHQDLRDMDKTKQQSSQGTAISSNTGPSSQVGGLFTSNPPSTGSNNQHQIGQTPDPNRPVHCDSCNMQSYFVGGLRHEHNETDSSSVPAREMDDDRPSPRFTSFCGVTLDQGRSGQLSEFHVLENDGDTESLESDEWKAMAKEVGGLEKLQSLVQIGLPAVRVRVGNAHLLGSAETMELSGFRLSHDLVITCAHFTNWKVAENNVQSFLDGANGVCEAVQAMWVGGKGHRNRFALRLWAIHKEWDIAVFRITHWPANDSKNCVVQKEDVHLATPEERRHLISAPRVRCWSIGYNLAVNMVEFRQRFEAFFSRRDGDEKTKIIQEYKFDGANPPGSNFLIPDIRTVSFGTNIEHPSYAKDHQECVELSAWYGRSGSMVCTEKDGRSTIIGIIQGGEEVSDCNLILLFNTEMTEWWNAATELGESPDTQAIGRRVVMY